MEGNKVDWRLAAKAVALALAAGLLAYICMAVARTEGRIAPIWLPNALAAAVLLRSSRREWPILIAAAFTGNLVSNLLTYDPVLIATGLAACNAVEYGLCAYIVRRMCGNELEIGRVRDLRWFITAAIGSSLLSGAIAASMLGFAANKEFIRSLVIWVQADALGLLVLTPCLLGLAAPRKFAAEFERREAWTLGALALVTAGTFVQSSYPLLFLVTPALILPAWRMGMPGAICGFVIISVISTIATFNNTGPLMLWAGGDRIVGLQVFLAISFLVTAPLAAAHDESRRLKRRLKAALVEASAARAAAEQSAAVKADFLANMSHELRTPLNSVVGFTRLVNGQADLTPQTRGYVNRIDEASRALLCIVNDVLDFSKIEAGQITFRPQTVDLSGLMRGALDLFTPEAGAKDIGLVFDGQGADVSVEIDPDRIRQVLLNLIGNAVKFTSEGQVTLRVSYDAAGERMTVEIEDTGPGIPADRVGLLFKRFSQVDGGLARAGGTGLGLAICKGIVETLGGQIGVTSEVGVGSRFWFEIPAALVGGALSEADNGEAQPDAVSLNVLVADDHPANRELARLFLGAVGAEIFEAEDGQEAVEMAGLRPYDVILMDMRMPRLDGAEALIAIRAGDGPNKATPILAFTGDVDIDVASEGFDGMVAKPLEPELLIAAVLNAAAQRAATAEPLRRVS